jgi:hypothetical protein
VDEIIGFQELRWLRELSFKTHAQAVPDLVGARLVKRGLVERKIDGYTLTAKGRIALVKLG